jgi:hypothetical protein
MTSKVRNDIGDRCVQNLFEKIQARSFQLYNDALNFQRLSVPVWNPDHLIASFLIMTVASAFQEISSVFQLYGGCFCVQPAAVPGRSGFTFSRPKYGGQRSATLVRRYWGSPKWWKSSDRERRRLKLSSHRDTAGDVSERWLGDQGVLSWTLLSSAVRFGSRDAVTSNHPSNAPCQ